MIPMRNVLAVIAVTLLLTGAGCKTDRAVLATTAMLPANLAIMPGLKPSDEQTWRLTGSKDQPIIDTHWRTPALFDQVEAYYVDFIGKTWGLATHTLETKDEVRIFWGLNADIRDAPTRANQFIRIAKAQTDGATSVEIVIEPRR